MVPYRLFRILECGGHIRVPRTQGRAVNLFLIVPTDPEREAADLRDLLREIRVLLEASLGG